MLKRNINNYLLIYLLRSILFSLLSFPQFINCETCSGANPPDINSPNFGESNCRYSVTKKDWFSCITTLDSGDNKKYFLIDSDGNCKFSAYCKNYNNAKTVRGTNECIESCARIHDDLKGNFIEYGDYCIYSTNDNNIFGYTQTSDYPIYDIIPNNGYKILKCNKVQKETIIDNMNYYECFNGSSCQSPDNYFDYEDHKCLPGCNNKKEIGDTKQCVSSCNQGSYIYESVDGKKCLESCGENQYYYYGEQKPIKCYDTCNDYILVDDEHNNACIKTCDDGKIYINDNKKYCNKKITSCPGHSPKEYANYCLSKCKSSNDLIKIETFQKKDESNKCIENCFQTDKSYKSKIINNDNDDYKCVANCGPDYFLDNLECVGGCPTNGNKYHIENKKECLSQCPDGYYTYDNVCYQRCPTIDSNKLYATDSNECVPCTENGQYYIVYDTDEENNNANIIRRCYSKCPVDYLFHDNDKHACYSTKNYLNCAEKNESAHNVYSYFKVDDPYTCYPSCGATTDYKNEIEKFHCSKELNCPFYYYTTKVNNNDVKICINEEALKTCYNLGKSYLRGKECIANCLETEFKVLPIEGGNIFQYPIDSLGKCCLNKEGCGDAPFYCKCESNLLRRDCPYKRIKNKNTDTTQIISSSEGNCVMNCPTEYPYENIDGDICLDSNDNQYYYKITENKYKLVSDCQSINRYHLNNSYECITIDKCVIEISTDNKQYLYYDNGICYLSCLDAPGNNNYSFDSSELGAPQKCLSSCPQGYYYLEKEYICLDKCDIEKGLFYHSSQNNQCVEKCSEGEFVLDGNKCVSECPPYMYIHTKLFEKNSKKLYINECIPDCSNTDDAKYHEEDDMNCIAECKTEGKKFKYGLTCVEKCPEGFYFENNECISLCSTKYFIKNYLDADKTKYNYQCIEVCDGYILPKDSAQNNKDECIERCPIGKNFVGKDKTCKNACGTDDGIYYEKREKAKQGEIEYIIYSCMKNITNISDGNYIVDGTTQIVNECPSDHPYLSVTERKCYDNCIKSPFYKFTAENGDNKICATECKGQDKKYYKKEDNICISECNDINYNIINDEDNSCVALCDLSSPYKFKTLQSDGKYHCSLKCDDSNPKYTTSDYLCYSECPAPYNYDWNNQCLLECPNNLFSQFNKTSTIDKEDKYTCTSECKDPRPFYYRTDLKCIQNCKAEDYVIENTKECTPVCDDINSMQYHIYKKENERKCVVNCASTDKKFLRENNECYDSCDENSYNYYAEDKICAPGCPKDYKVIITGENQKLFECAKNCQNGLFEDINKYCISDCKNSYSGYHFYNSDEKICLPSCNNTLYYTQGYECVTSCDPKKFIDGRTCRDVCPPEKRYFVEVYTHGETNIKQKECLYKCPENYNFIEIKEEEINGKQEKKYICTGSCERYISREDYNECVTSCVDPNIFYELDQYGRKSCVNKCPENAPLYYKKNKDGQAISSDISCLKECPDKTYKETNSNECVDVCSTKIVDYETKKCVYGCTNIQYWSKVGDITYCLSKCTNEFGSFIAVGNECVKSCSEKNLVVNYVDNTCVCPNLYILDRNGNSVCLPTSITTCGKDSTYPTYKFRLASSNQCTESCFGVLSTNGELCYSSYNNCSHIPNTYIVSENENLKCDCQYNYYYVNDKELDSGKRKMCLGENDECPVPYLLLNVETKECIQDCNGLYQLDYKCFKDCPDKTKKDEEKKICKYLNNWYVDDNNGNIFLPEGAPCPTQFPFLIYETKECTNNCSTTRYSYIYKDVCYSSCQTVSNLNQELPFSRVKPREFSKYYQRASYECQCSNKWYKDTKEDIICTSDDKCPTDGDYKYIIKETKECVKSCPTNYHYNFNLECFESCENAKSSYQYPVKTVEGSFECSCENLWRKTADGFMECLVDVNCKEDELLIKETKECVVGEGDKKLCPKEYPLKYNNVCYKKGNCPEKTKANAEGNECICENLWYWQDTGNKYCLEKTISECPFETHPYKIYSTKECIKDKCSDLKTFDNTCYDECPSGTIAEGDNDCICDKQLGFWYIEIDSNKKQKVNCGLIGCPPERKYNNNRTKECLEKECGEYQLYLYNNTCYEGQCPNPTVSEDPVNNPFVCTTKKYSTSTSINETYNYVKEEIIQLYKTIPESGLVYNNFNATMQVYGIKSGVQKADDLSVRSGISHIDIGACSKKVYEANGMQKGEEIVVLKFDLENQRRKSLINPVEYEFVNSRTGKKLDMSVCKKNDVVISYSLFDILNNFKKVIGRKVEEITDDNEFDAILSTIQKQYQKAKKIKSEYDMDSFDINSALYEDICMTFEVQGKDLVLEDRVGYLYPYYSLCEENCTYSHMDFELERIYCNCPLKDNLDLSREHKFTPNINNSEEIMIRQKGPTNFPVVKCTSRLKERKTFTDNEGFYFSIVILFLQVVLLFLTIFYNYKNLKAKINRNSSNNEIGSEGIEKEFNIEEIDVGHKKKNPKQIKNKKEKNIKSSERVLNSPPQKKRNIKIDKVVPSDMKFKNKEIGEKENIPNDANETINDLDGNFDDNSSEDSISKDYFLGILDSIRQEQKSLRIKYEAAIQREKSDSFIIILTEIFDKIYLIKTLCLLSKYDMFSIYFSLYLLYHLLLLSFVTCFYDIKTIHNIYIKDNYPNIGYHLGYGIVSCLIVWVIYKIFLCILTNDDKIQRYIKKRIDSSNDSESNVRRNSRKFNDLLCSIKTGMIVYFVIQFIFALVCLLYVTLFCAVYVGTKTQVFKTYAIALLEVLIIKIVYGIILGILRKVGLSKRSRIAYQIAYYFDKLLH